MKTDNPFLQHSDALENRQRMRAVLLDYFPNERVKANVLVIAYDSGIVTAIRDSNLLDSAFALRFVKLLTSDFAIQSRMAKWAVQYWMEMYGVQVLGKAKDTLLEVESSNENDSDDDSLFDYTELNLSSQETQTGFEKRIKDFEDGEKIAKSLIDIQMQTFIDLGVNNISCAFRKDYSNETETCFKITGAYEGKASQYISLIFIPEYSGSVSVTVNNNVPFFEEKDFSLETFEHYSPLDSLGRCGVAMACIGLETMPTEERGSIGMIKPSGWKTIRYDDLIEDRYLYNRCHLIAYMLAGENANEKNLITGTRYFNVSGMLPYESETANYIRKTSNHVLYRVTPCFLGDNLVATGVLMEAQSVEDGGRGLQFNVFVFNVQPGIQIDYLTGDSERSNR